MASGSVLYPLIRASVSAAGFGGSVWLVSLMARGLSARLVSLFTMALCQQMNSFWPSGLGSLLVWPVLATVEAISVGLARKRASGAEGLVLIALAQDPTE